VSARASVKRTPRARLDLRRLAAGRGVAEEAGVAKDIQPRLRAAPLASPFRIVLVEPEIPQNTGNIARLAAATQSPLHLVGRLGFRIDEKAVRRAGIDYWHLVTLEQHLDLAHFGHAHPGARLRLFSAVGGRSYLDAGFRPGDALVFGKESVGLEADLLDRHPDAVFGIPTLGPVRSLNLANAVAIVVYEALRQVGALAAAAPG
jgi:tRNA (cytidine/uridine-2'-O-)-methyltransferase